MSTIKSVKLPRFGGLDDPRPAISTQQYRARLAQARRAMQQHSLDVLVVYGDREHFANLAYLTGFDPRFEEALLLLDEGRAKLLAGNECMGYLPPADLGLEVERFQEFSLLGQPRGRSRPLRAILEDFGVRPGRRIGCAGWKYFESPAVEGGPRAMEIPSYIADLLRELAGRENVSNATDLFMNPRDGLRAINSADQIAFMEWAAVRTSQAVLSAMRRIKPSVRECDLEKHLVGGGLPLSCHTMINFGQKVRRGLSSPSDRQAELGDPYQIAYGLWGSLTCRAGAVAANQGDLPAQTREFYGQFAAGYFDVVAAWYRSLRVRALAGEVFAAAEARRDPALFEFAVNPGHLIHLDEWLHSPFQAGSDVPLASGMAIQMDIIPVSTGPFCYANAEDGVVLADKPLRKELSARWGGCWRRMRRRRRFMAEAMGIRLDESVLPLSNMPAWLPPFVMDPGSVLTAW